MTDNLQDPYREPVESNIDPETIKNKVGSLSDSAEIERLEKLLAEKREIMAKRTASTSQITDKSNAPTINAVKSSTANPVSDQSVDDEENRVQILVNLAFTESLDKAISKAKQYDDPYLLDRFHDEIIDHLYQDLISRGKLQSL